MRTRWMTLTLLACFAGSPLPAQRTSDQARLSLGVAAGATVGTDLWDLRNQPIFDNGSNVDSMAISRRLRSSLAVVFHGTYFPGEHWGFTGEAMLIGLGFEDTCNLAFASGSSSNAAVCRSLNKNTPASAVALSVGTMYRIWSRKPFSPYARVHAGLAMTQHSGIKLVGTFADSTSPDVTDIVLFTDEDSKTVTPVLGLGIGFTANLGHGYQLRWEARDNITGVDKVTGTTFGAPNLSPPHKITYKHVFSITFGFDVVLERRRGRRY